MTEHGVPCDECGYGTIANDGRCDTCNKPSAMPHGWVENELTVADSLPRPSAVSEQRFSVTDDGAYVCPDHGDDELLKDPRVWTTDAQAGAVPEADVTQGLADALLAVGMSGPGAGYDDIAKAAIDYLANVAPDAGPEPYPFDCAAPYPCEVAKQHTALRAALAASQARVAELEEAFTTVKRLWAKATRSIADLRGELEAERDKAQVGAVPECDHDVVAALQELINTMPLPGRAVGFMSDAVAELIHLRWQRDRLQKRGSELVKERQAARSSVDRKLKDLAAEELHKEIRWLTERALMAERVAFKLSEYFDQYDSPGEFLTEPECYVLESIDYRQGLLGPPGDTSCKEPTCTRKHYVHTKECGCSWDHVTNSWSGCETHASSEWSPVVGGSKSGKNE